MPRNKRPAYGIPKGITKRHVEHAAAEIERNHVPAGRRSRSQAVEIGKGQYPLKYVISLAAKYATGRVLPSSRFHATVHARPYLERLGYKVIDLDSSVEDSIASQHDESASPEGRERFRMHRFLERKVGIVRKAKALRLEETGTLACEVCGHDFAKKYGSLGQGFIEAHHTTPVSQLDGETKTKITDLAKVCSNCHRMLHHCRLSVKELRKARRGAKD